MQFRHLAIEGPPAVGKTALADRMAIRLDASLVLDDQENPFLADAHRGRAGAAFQAQLFSLLARHRQQETLRQGDLFSQATICDYLFEKDRVYAFLNLDDNELFIYQRLYDLLARDVPAPDLVLYLQAPADVLWRRFKQRRRELSDLPLPDEDFVRELVDAYNHFFFHYSATPLLVIETSQLDLTWGDEVVEELLRQMQGMTGGTRYYVARTS